MAGAFGYGVATNTLDSPQNIGAALFGIGTGILAASIYGVYVLTDVYRTIDENNKDPKEGCF
jgi:hypothetical protein